MKRLKSYMFAGVIFVSVLGTLMHFVYEWSGYNSIIGFIAPINESVWEHTKLLFFPMLIYSIYVTRKLKSQYPCIGSAMAFGTVFGTILIPILFYTYSGILGYYNLVLDIGTFYLSVIISFYTAYKSALSCKMKKHITLLTILLFMLIIMFFVFTVLPPNIPLFIAP